MPFKNGEGKMVGSDLRVVALVEINKSVGLVLNRQLKFVYEKAGQDFIGKDGPFTRFLYYEKSTSNFRAFAGAELKLPLIDGSTVAVKNDWWSGLLKDHCSVAVGSVEELKKCYVFSGVSIREIDLFSLKKSYSGCVYPYWDYDKVIRFDDMRRDLCKKLWHEERRRDALIAEVKKMSKELESLRRSHAPMSSNPRIFS